MLTLGFSTIRIWSADGDELQQLYGHTNYIYSIAALPSGEIISSGEDRTVRIWKGLSWSITGKTGYVG